MNNMQMNYSPQDTPSDATAGQATNSDETKQASNASLAANLAEKLDKEVLGKLSNLCKNGFNIDLNSRQMWEDKIKDWEQLALQIQEDKTWPWPGAANVKYPLLSTASMQFAARAYPSLIPSNAKIVQASVIGKDPTGQKLELADRVSTYISYQVMRELCYWEEEMDKLLIMLPVVGCMFKKTYYCKETDYIESKLILPRNIVVNYWTTRIDESERISEVIRMSPRVLKEKQTQGIYLDIDLGDPPTPEEYNQDYGYSTDKETTPYEIVEQHTFYDLDEDGYDEPLIVTFERNSGTILRVAIRYYLEDVQRNEKDDITKITPICMYTKFSFVPSPDGSFYDAGFGQLLGPLNDSVNTLINQLLDSGTLHNLNSGFIGKALRLKAGDTAFNLGEWKPVNATGDDLRKQIVPLPAKEPSSVLLELLKFLVTAGKELASVAEIFTGKMPGQNTPATTTMASIDQGMKVFTAIYKRLYRSLGEEFDKFFKLNGRYLDPNKYVTILDATVGPDDFDDTKVDIYPGADPTAVTQNEKLQKAQGLMEIMQMFPGLLDPVKVAMRVLEAQEQPNYQELLAQQVQQSGQLPPPPPDPKIQALQMKSQIDQQKAGLDAQQQQQSMELEGRSKEQQMAMAAQEHVQKLQFSAQDHQLSAASKLDASRVKIAAEQMQHQQGLVHQEQTHQQKLVQTKESARLQSQNKK